MASTEPYKPHPASQTLSLLPPALPPTTLSRDLQSQKPTLPLLVILDDDPTGTQTCHNINVLMTWDHATLLSEIAHATAPSTTVKGFFILTNSRALPTTQARDLIREICEAVHAAAQDSASHPEIEIVLRGDSTLRGHFPDEPAVADEVFGASDGWILAPFFRQGGRLTIDDVHWVLADGELTPAAQTPFARDATFGYGNSHLGAYVEEKSKGGIKRGEVVSVGLGEIRGGEGRRVVREKLLGLGRGKQTVVVVNAVEDSDMEVFVQGLLDARREGERKFTYRTGAAFVSTRLGIEQIDPITPEMDRSEKGPGGLILAGSYVPKTTAQLESLVQGRGEQLKRIELDVESLIKDSNSTAITDAAEHANKEIAAGNDVLVMTSRKLVTGHDENSSLAIGSVVADSLVKFMALLETRPRYVIAKGGITSSDAATKGLRMKRAQVVGQAASGVPLWECHEETSKFKSIPYVVFPGNVGTNDTLRDLVAKWSKRG